MLNQRRIKLRTWALVIGILLAVLLCHVAPTISGVMAIFAGILLADLITERQSQ